MEQYVNMMARTITGDEIRDFLTWYFTRSGKETERVVLLAISAAGHFHTTEKAATPLIRRAIASGFLTKCGENAVKLSL